MTPRQRAAFELPCQRGYEVMDHRLYAIMRVKGATWSTLLSVNK
jgi:hypothetical protein